MCDQRPCPSRLAAGPNFPAEHSCFLPSHQSGRLQRVVRLLVDWNLKRHFPSTTTSHLRKKCADNSCYVYYIHLHTRAIPLDLRPRRAHGGAPARRYRRHQQPLERRPEEERRLRPALRLPTARVPEGFNPRSPRRQAMYTGMYARPCAHLACDPGGGLRAEPDAACCPGRRKRHSSAGCAGVGCGDAARIDSRHGGRADSRRRRLD